MKEYKRALYSPSVVSVTLSEHALIGGDEDVRAERKQLDEYRQHAKIFENMAMEQLYENRGIFHTFETCRLWLCKKGSMT